MTTERMTSYTHNCEDVLLLRALKDVESGFYIDVGAYDPVMDSVTKVFYDRGWCGLNLEPNPTYLARLQEMRPRDSNVGIAASDRTETVVFNIVEETGLSSLDAEQARISAADRHHIQTITVRTMPLSALWDARIPVGQQVHFLKVDVEGSEDAVIAGVDWTRHRPWILVIEATAPNTSIESHGAWEPTILAADYSYAYFDSVNRYYVANERSELLGAFDRPANPMVDNFKPFLAELIERNMQGAIDSLKSKLSDMAAGVEGLNQTMIDLRRLNTLLEARIDDLSERNLLLEDNRNRADELLGAVSQLGQQMERLSAASAYKQSRALWERIVFHRDGRPRKLFRRVFFHKSGKPRGMFRSRILKADGSPHKPFRMWMTSPGYQQLRSAVQFGKPLTLDVRLAQDVIVVAQISHPPDSDLSPRSRLLLEDLENRLTNTREIRVENDARSD
ncbi:MAG: FkbM family methyltransferase [Rhodobacter sp.]|nr:FkbM family methyltransferase [Rhodobacter sp.]